MSNSRRVAANVAALDTRKVDLAASPISWPASASTRYTDLVFTSTWHTISKKSEIFLGKSRRAIFVMTQCPVSYMNGIITLALQSLPKRTCYCNLPNFLLMRGYTNNLTM